MRTVTAQEFPGVRFHEVAARSALNAVPAASRVPFRWTVNPYRGCTHACVYCFARGTHAWLELDTGTGFDREIVVKVNVVDVLRAELARRSWGREHVALGTNTDPYQRAEGRYKLMPGVHRRARGLGHAVLDPHQGHAAPARPAERSRRPRVTCRSGSPSRSASRTSASSRSLEPGTPGPRARLDLVRAIRRPDCRAACSWLRSCPG